MELFIEREFPTLLQAREDILGVFPRRVFKRIWNDVEEDLGLCEALGEFLWEGSLSILCHYLVEIAGNICAQNTFYVGRGYWFFFLGWITFFQVDGRDTEECGTCQKASENLIKDWRWWHFSFKNAEDGQDADVDGRYWLTLLDVTGSSEESRHHGPVRSRSCTDIFFLLIFIAFLVGWGVIGYSGKWPTY